MHIQRHMPGSPRSRGSHQRDMQVDTNLSGVGCSTVASTATTAYATHHDLTPYSAVSSFNLPATADSTLLTPTSSSGSPSSRHLHLNLNYQQPQQQQQGRQQQQEKRSQQNNHQLSHKAAEADRSLDAPSSSPSSHSLHHSYPHQQQLTPPATSRMIYQYPATASTQAEQPSSATSFGYDTYIHTSPKDEGLPTTIGSYPFDSYQSTVSSAETSNTNMDYQFINPPASLYQRLPVPHSPYSQQHPQQAQTPAPGSAMHHQGQQQPVFPPQLSAPSPGVYRPRLNIPTYHEAPALPSTSHPASPFISGAPGNEGRPSVVGRRRVAPIASDSAYDPSTPRRQPSISNDMNHIIRENQNKRHSPVRGGPDADAKDAASIESELTTDLPYVVLSDKASAEEQFLFHLHQECKGTRGKGMWDAISNKYGEKYPSGTTTARLQMKFTRSFRKHCLWPTAEFELLKQVYLEDEQHRFARLAEALKEKGGGKVWDWKAADIEMMLCRMGYEEKEMDEATKTRRRRRSAQRRQSTLAAAQQQQQQQSHQDVAANMTQAWAGAYSPAAMAHHAQYALPTPHSQHHHHSVSSSSPYEVGDTIGFQTETYTSDQDNETLLDQMERKYDKFDRTSSASLERDDMHMMDAGAPSSAGSAASHVHAAVGMDGTSGVSLPLPLPSTMSSAGQYGMVTGLSARSDRMARESYDQLDAQRVKTELYR